MKPVTVLLLLLSVAACQAPERESSPTSFPDSTVARRMLADAIAGIDQNAVDPDPSFFEASFAEDYLFTGQDGATAGKSQIIEGLRESRLSFDSYSTDQLDIRLYGHAAVVAGRIQAVESPPGEEPFSWVRRFTSTWIWMESQWRLVAWHISEVAGQ